MSNLNLILSHSHSLPLPLSLSLSFKHTQLYTHTHILLIQFFQFFLFKSSNLLDSNNDPEASIPPNHTVSFFDNSALLDNVLESSNVENDLGNFIASEFGLSPFFKNAKRKSEEIHQEKKVLKTGKKIG